MPDNFFGIKRTINFMESVSGLRKQAQEIQESLELDSGLIWMEGVSEDILQNNSSEWFLAFSQMIGTPISQSAQGELIFNVRDEEYGKQDNRTRGPNTNRKLGFHTDRCDVIGFLCLQPAKLGGESRVASSITLYNEMLKRRPEFVADLCKDFYWTKHGEHSSDDKPWYKLPVFNFKEGKFSGKGASTHARKAQDLPGAEPWDALRNEAVNLFQEMVSQLAADLPFQEGDLQILNSHVTLHSRRPYEDWEDPSQKRHLYRLWLENEHLRPVPDVVRNNLKGVIMEGFTPCTPLDAEEAA